ncbi:hypothetical protein EHW99_2297 [Erwinia amylovora]|uniref:Uncharacterized protein n=2 Tax=Erwinia amylovora TaxID=552 RepID=A0A830ZXZ9_ERWAM|nr:hypothetical protein EaACW_1293 [Erwinia amylovora ACW56400]QJQ54999.1 hypothetical protein EHX00_2297 [Erwinia amylovora]CBA20233.1 hypothetical protein predicted by Glimmer/Critica [Erwinia amylovora CFBP1430]CBJ45955.1 hypothetical protein EAM_1280 [Erwinia amylovora ATCC 49946]CCO78141.1 hypothetical protein BN432_1331 [Erwinia amylovora Ea356]CCO81926.1 hypothetical protein BN433_1342 [Erwinia amylovora Ea266]CCO85725.1 hypothetical protein BN434_1325 [Erwinia amylovora CFBP 2585]CCO
MPSRKRGETSNRPFAVQRGKFNVFSSLKIPTAGLHGGKRAQQFCIIHG